MNIFGWLTLDTLKEILLHPILVRIWEGAVPVVVDGIRKSLEEHRAEVMEFIVRLDLQNLLRRIREAQARNEEIRVMNGLTKLFMYLSAANELANREQLFIDLDKMDDPAFDAVITALEHDVIRQWFKRTLRHLRAFGGSAANLVAAANAAAAERLKETNSWLETNWQAARQDQDVPATTAFKWLAAAIVVATVIVAVTVHYLAH